MDLLRKKIEKRVRREKFKRSAIFKEIKESDIGSYNFHMMLILPEKIKDRSPAVKRTGEMPKEDRYIDYLSTEERKDDFKNFPAMIYVFLRNVAIVNNNTFAFHFFNYGLTKWYQKIDLSNTMLIEIHRRIFIDNIAYGRIKIDNDLAETNKRVEQNMKMLGLTS